MPSGMVILVVEDELAVALDPPSAAEGLRGRVRDPAATVGDALAILADQDRAAAVPGAPDEAEPPIRAGALFGAAVASAVTDRRPESAGPAGSGAKLERTMVVIAQLAHRIADRD